MKKTIEESLSINIEWTRSSPPTRLLINNYQFTELNSFRTIRVTTHWYGTSKVMPALSLISLPDGISLLWPFVTRYTVDGIFFEDEPNLLKAICTYYLEKNRRHMHAQIAKMMKAVAYKNLPRERFMFNPETILGTKEKAAWAWINAIECQV